MSNTFISQVDSDALPGKHLLSALRAPLAWTAISAGIALAWQGGWAGLGGVALGVVASAYACKLRMAAHVTGADSNAHQQGDDDDGAARVGAETMVAQVVPVWGRQVDATRESANEGLTQLLMTFTEMSDALQTLSDSLGQSASSVLPGAVEQAMSQESVALSDFKAAAARAFSQRDAAVSELARCGKELMELQRLAKQSREIARHTRLVAFNASIESCRAHDAQSGGSQAVAVEVRMLAERMAEAGDNIDRAVNALNDTVQKARQTGEVNDTSPDELSLEIDLQARQALRALLASVGASGQGALEVQQASHKLRSQLDDAFVLFQFGDRVSQMLDIIAKDMDQLVKWIAANPKATQTDAAHWLAALEANYTMDEQRSHHHGNVHVERDTGVEFF